MLNFNSSRQHHSNRNYLNCVPLIDSQCDSQNYPIKSSSMISNNNNFYKSPLRDRENKMNISNMSNYTTTNNTPLRAVKTSLSPLRLRKNNQQNSLINMSSNNNANKSIFSRKKQQPEIPADQLCFNHPQKSAQFYLQAPEQVMYCCQKCAILLASQGFKVCRLQSAQIQSSSHRQVYNPRKQEIQHFMTKLQGLTKKLQKNQTILQQKFNKGQDELTQQLNKIEDYYQQFYQILNEHKKRVVQQIREEYEKNNSSNIQLKRQHREAIEETTSMKKDILDSMNDIIFVAEQHQYRPVFNSYNQKLQKFEMAFKNCSEDDFSDFIVRKLNFKNTQSACEALEKGLQVEWCDEYKENQQQEQISSEMNKFSKQSDLPENPVECIEKDEKFIKSSLKELVGLFSSFEE